MDQQQHGQRHATGSGGRKLHIGHRRSPSEMTPFMAQQLQLTMNAGQLPTVEQIAIQQQIELLQAQQAQILAQQQYLTQHAAQQGQQNFAFPAQQQGIPILNTQGQPFQFPPQQQQGTPPGSNQHRRNQSAMPGIGQTGGPPPAPSTGTANIGDVQQVGGGGHQQQQQGGGGGGGNQSRENTPQRRTSGGGGPGGGHQRRHSLALPEARKAAELAQQARKGGSPSAGTQPTGFQFPIPGDKSGDNKDATSPSTKTLTPTSGVSLTARSLGRASHGRSQSMAIGSNGRSPAGGLMGSFQFPASNANKGSNAGSGEGGQGGSGVVERRGSSSGGYSGHTRSQSRNFEGNWRQPQNQNNEQQQQQQQQQQQGNQQGGGQQGGNYGSSGFTPGHRSRASMGASVGSMGSFSFPGQPQLLVPGQQGMLFNAMGQPLINAGLLQQQQQLNQLQLQQAAQALSAQQQLGLQQLAGATGGGHGGMNQQQQQRKTLFTPYLPQANLPALLNNGQLVSGILRVNKKNRSDAYVTTLDGLLDADIFICGSKDRNRALEGDMVAVELLDVDDVWGQKREKEEKKKRKDISDTRTGGDRQSGGGNDDGGSSHQEGGLRRRGSLRQRPIQKKNDDVEVEGQGLLLVEEEEISDEQKPLYAGHIVAVIERVAGQMFSGTLGLLRPSSQATKEKQEAERQASGRPSQPERQQDKPKIVWFKPTDKRVPLIAIPTEQAPRDFVDNHQTYANRIFVACIKRWPITSLHPFGTLVEQLGEMGDIKIETDALLRDNNFGPDEFSDAVLKSVGYENWTVESEGEKGMANRKDFREERTFTIDPNGAKDLEDAIHIKKVNDDIVEIGVHITDVAHFVKANSLVDREAKKRGTGVSLINRSVPMLPQKLAEEVASLKPGEERFTVSIIFKVEILTAKVLEDETWVGKGVIKSSGTLAFKDVDRVIMEDDGTGLDPLLVEDVKLLHSLTSKFRQARFDADNLFVPSLRLFAQLDDENVPVEDNLFTSVPSHEVIEELMIKTNSFIASKISTAMPEKALLRRHAQPQQRRLESFADRMKIIKYDVDTSTSAALQKSLFKIEDADLRKGLETVLNKTMHRAKYFVAGKVPQGAWNHYSLNVPVYTHFTNPLRRYADVIVHRQLDAVLSAQDGNVDFSEDMEQLAKTAEQCNVKKDSAKNAQEQSIHLELCRVIDKTRVDAGGELICEAVVIHVYESAFDVLIPEYGFEKRVHCDQLPLKKAEFDKKTRLLELFWEKGVQSSSYIPEDERPTVGTRRAAANSAAAANAAAAAQAAKEQEEAQRKAMEISTLSSDDVDALFDDEDVTEVTDQMGGVNLTQTGSNNNRPTQSMPPSPTKSSSPSSSQAPHRTRSDPKMASTAAEKKQKAASKKELYMSMFTLREENGDYIQEIREMTRVPVILRAELSKSPPCLTTRTVNPYAL